MVSLASNDCARYEIANAFLESIEFDMYIACEIAFLLLPVSRKARAIGLQHVQRQRDGTAERLLRLTCKPDHGVFRYDLATALLVACRETTIATHLVRHFIAYDKADIISGWIQRGVFDRLDTIKLFDWSCRHKAIESIRRLCASGTIQLDNRSEGSSTTLLEKAILQLPSETVLSLLPYVPDLSRHQNALLYALARPDAAVFDALQQRPDADVEGLSSSLRLNLQMCHRLISRKKTCWLGLRALLRLCFK